MLQIICTFLVPSSQALSCFVTVWEQTWCLNLWSLTIRLNILPCWTISSSVKFWKNIPISSGILTSPFSICDSFKSLGNRVFFAFKSSLRGIRDFSEMFPFKSLSSTPTLLIAFWMVNTISSLLMIFHWILKVVSATFVLVCFFMFKREH